MGSAMKSTARSTFIANPLLGIPNMVPTSAKVAAGKEMDSHIELYHSVELQGLPTYKLLEHCVLIQKALTASLSLIESLRLSNNELEGEHEKMKSRIKENGERLANVTTELLQTKEQIEAGSSKPKRAPRGAAAKQLKEMEEARDTWKKAFEDLKKHKEGGQALDDCNAKVKELQEQLAKECHQREELQKRYKDAGQKSKMPAKGTFEQGQGSQTSVPHQQHLKSLQEERGETDAQALQRVRQNREELLVRVNELKISNAEVLAKEKDYKETIGALQERNKELCAAPIVHQRPPQASTLPAEEWYFIHETLNQTLEWFQRILDDAEVYDLKLPKKHREYRALLKQFGSVLKTLRDYEASQPPHEEPHQIGDEDFRIDEHGSNLLKPVQEMLGDPRIIRVFDIHQGRLGNDRTGIGADKGSTSSLKETAFVPASTRLLQEEEKTEQERPVFPQEDPEWARLHTPPHCPMQSEGLDAFANIDYLLQQKDSTSRQLFRKEDPPQPILREDQVQERVLHLQELFGSSDVDQKERYLSELKAVHGDNWKFTSDPFLLHIRLKKIAPIPYTEWPNRTRFQIYPYSSDWHGSHGTSDSKARQEGFSWAWVRFKTDGFSAHNLTDFMEIRIVTEELKYLARHWIREHRDEATNGSQEMPQFKTPEWEHMLQFQPSWRHMYLKKEELYKVYKAAPSSVRADPLFYPTERRWAWKRWEALKAKDQRISYNFPLMPKQDYNSLMDFQAAMIGLLESWNLIPDPAIVATCRFLKLILLLTKLKNYNALECASMRMVYNLSQGPDIHQMNHYFHKVKYIGGNYLITFEDMFDTRFWDPQEELYFTRHTPYPEARYNAMFTDKAPRRRSKASLRDASTHS